jgi:chorismate mutase
MHRTYRFALTGTLLLGLLSTAGLAAAQPPSTETDKQAVDRLLQLMRQRLLLMHDVARWKWQAGKAITDSEREQALLRQMVEQGQPLGLEPDTTRGFFLAQMQAGKQIQEDLFAHWRKTGKGPTDKGPDLAALRQRIDKLNRDLLATLVRARPFLQQPAGAAWLQERMPQVLSGQGITAAVRQRATAPLLAR